MKAFIESQFGYCTLICMFHGRGVNNKINHLHERSLRVEDNNSSFKDLLKGAVIQIEEALINDRLRVSKVP